MHSGFFYLGKGVMNNGYRKPTPEARVSFMLATGIPPDHQIDLEKFFDSHTPAFREEYCGIYPELYFL
jgi:hypothetical protein